MILYGSNGSRSMSFSVTLLIKMSKMKMTLLGNKVGSELIGRLVWKRSTDNLLYFAVVKIDTAVESCHFVLVGWRRTSKEAAKNETIKNIIFLISVTAIHKEALSSASRWASCTNISRQNAFTYLCLLDSSFSSELIVAIATQNYTVTMETRSLDSNSSLAL